MMKKNWLPFQGFNEAIIIAASQTGIMEVDVPVWRRIFHNGARLKQLK